MFRRLLLSHPTILSPTYFRRQTTWRPTLTLTSARPRSLPMTPVTRISPAPPPPTTRSYLASRQMRRAMTSLPWPRVTPGQIQVGLHKHNGSAKLGYLGGTLSPECSVGRTHSLPYIKSLNTGLASNTSRGSDLEAGPHIQVGFQKLDQLLSL